MWLLILEDPTMPKASVNNDACIGCGLCVGSAPDVFEFGDDGKAVAIEGVEADASADEAAANCPVSAITIE